MKREAGGPRIARLLLFLLLAAMGTAARADPAGDALARARAAKVWEEPQWLRLGHWKPSRWLRALESDATTSFFIIPDGARDPRAELEADVSGLFAPDPGDGRHFRCRFPARAAWLEERLQVRDLDEPAADCSKFKDWRRLLDAGGASLIFASSYLNNPSSMFGHTFLRLERRATSDDDRLRDNTLNFAADTGDDGGVAFAVKGLLGLYPGSYTVMPYYMKIAEYNDVENRDLWEYRLALSTAEVERLVAHAWEMGQTGFPYYFFSRNCSYQLLPALEAAAPRLNLMPGTPPIVAPADALLAVREAPGLTSEARYRPSHATTMAQRRKGLSPAERRAAEAYAAGHADEGDRLSAGLPSARRAAVLDAAEDYILYKRGFAPDASDEVRALERPVLVRRAREADAPAEPAPPSWAAPPEDGHLRHRLAVGEGARNGGSFTELYWRPGYHDLLDRPRGFVPGAEIFGFSGRVRYDRDDRKFYVRDARLGEILSIAPWDPWTRKPSWSMGTGLDTAFELGKPAYRAQVYEAHAGAGVTAALWDGALAFVLAGTEGSVGAALHDGWRGAAFARAGLTADLGARWRALLDGTLSGTVLGDKTPNHRLRAGLNWAPARDRALRLEGLWRGPYREVGLHAALYH